MFDCNAEVSYNKLRQIAASIPDSELRPWLPVADDRKQVVARYTWQSLAELPDITERQLYLVSVDGVPVMVCPPCGHLGITVMAYQKAGKSVLVQVILNDPTEDELHAAGF
jgi:hypothetical protein